MTEKHTLTTLRQAPEKKSKNVVLIGDKSPLSEQSLDNIHAYFSVVSSSNPTDPVAIKYASDIVRVYNMHTELVEALSHAVEIAEAKRVGNWDDLLQYRGVLNKATKDTEL